MIDKLIDRNPGHPWRNSCVCQHQGAHAYPDVASEVGDRPGCLSPSCPKHKQTQDRRAGAVSIVIDPWRAPDLGRVGGDVGDSGSPYAQGKHRPATGCHAPGRRPGSRPGPHLDQNVLAGYAAVALVLILGLSCGLFSAAARPVSTRSSYWAQTWHSKIAIRDKTRKWGPFSPSSASLVTPDPAKPRQPRGKSHLSLQCHNCRTEWRMGQFGAIG